MFYGTVTGDGSLSVTTGTFLSSFVLSSDSELGMYFIYFVFFVFNYYFFIVINGVSEFFSIPSIAGILNTQGHLFIYGDMSIDTLIINGGYNGDLHTLKSNFSVLSVRSLQFVGDTSDLYK